MSQPDKKRRSRNGCIECRTRHRKCDETKPTCVQCRSANRVCSYEFRLSWGGRSFTKSRFGKCLNADPSLKAVSADEKKDGPVYVYSLASPVKDSPQDLLHSDKSAEHFVEELPHDEEAEAVETTTTTALTTTATQSGNVPLFDLCILDSVRPTASPFPWLPHEDRALLDHFISCTTTSLSCHQLIREEINSVLVPMAAHAPCLLSSLLCLAATNRISLGLEQSTFELHRLKMISIRQLLNAISLPGGILQDAVIASVLVLCTTDIVSFGQSPGSWRAHLQGAATILSEHMKHARQSGVQAPSLPHTANFFWRWFVSIEMASMMSGGKSVVPVTMSTLSLAMRAHAEQLYAPDEIDDFAGFSISLITVFNVIKQLEADIADPACDSASIASRCGDLVADINQRISSHRPFFRPDVATSLSTDQRLDFTAINVSFHHVALLRVYRNVCRLPSSDALVQNSVSTIISLCASTKLLRAPCPRVAVLQPLFAAGCEAIHDVDMANITSLLERQEMAYGMGNARDARLFLQELWKRRELELDFEGTLRWDQVMFEKGLDILPY
ncbi:hypothetical protein KEM56_001287 [Ascosphaera pollenicola]|nr:hypothetical protein KEM56_001287 [Ascosphaera pollenicola]